MMNKIATLSLILIIWVNITSFVCWVKNPELSQMQVFMRIPKSVVLDFE